MMSLKKISFALSLLLALASLYFWKQELMEYLAPAIIGSLLFLALGLNRSSQFKGFAFTVLIFAAVAASLFYPQAFLEINGFQLSELIVPLLIIIMFGMGTSIGIQDFVGVVKMPKGVLVGLLAQFTIMPFIGFGLARLSDLPPEIAAGIILVGCSPSGLASNVMAYICLLYTSPSPRDA